MAKDPAMGPITRYDRLGNSRVDRGDGPPPITEEIMPEPTTEKRDLKVVILAGGRGTRLQDETGDLIPKPLVKIGLMPMLQHIIYYYADGEYNQFIVAGGHLVKIISDWHEEMREVFQHRNLNVLITDTGVETQTAGRLLRLKYYLSKTFMMTYGDGLANVNLAALIEFHRLMREKHEVLVTLTAVNPPSRFGELKIEDGLAKLFVEKGQSESGWINGGFYVIEPEALSLISGDKSKWEYDVLPVLANQNRLAAYKHPSYFQMCDTARDLALLRKIWDSGEAPWKI